MEQGPFKKVIEFPKRHGFKEIPSPEGSFISRKMGVNKAASRLEMSPDDPVEVVKKVKSSFDNVKNEYNIPVAVNFVLADGPDKKKFIHILSDKIEGFDLNPHGTDAPHYQVIPMEEKRDMAVEINNLLESLSRYILENINKKDFLWDIATSKQYMWGRRTGENGVVEDKPHLYLVDVDFFINNPLSLKVYADSFRRTIEYFEDLLKTRLDKGREAMQKLVEGKVIEAEDIPK